MFPSNDKPIQVCTCARFRKRIDDKQVIKMATDGDIKMEYPHVQKKPTNTNEEKIQIDPTPPTTPPNHQPRTSQDFKMRILTKKKVNLPPSASNHSRANLESLRGSQFKK